MELWLQVKAWSYAAKFIKFVKSVLELSNICMWVWKYVNPLCIMGKLRKVVAREYAYQITNPFLFENNVVD